MRGQILARGRSVGVGGIVGNEKAALLMEGAQCTVSVLVLLVDGIRCTVGSLLLS